MIALHRGICPKNGTGKVFKGKGGYPADVRPVTNLLYSKMVYSASLRLAVRERFELPDPFGSSVFKTDGLSHSPTLPCCPPERAIVFCVFDAPRFTALVVVSRGNPPRKAFPVIRRTRQTFFCAKVSDRATLHSPQAYYYPRTF